MLYWYTILTGVFSLAILYGLSLLSNVKTAVRGNKICATAMVLAILATIIKDGSYTSFVVIASAIIGSVIGLYIAKIVKMIQMPQLVAFLNGIGGGAAGIVGLLILLDKGTFTSSGGVDYFAKGTAGLALVTGMMTIAGAFVAAGKLNQMLPQKPVVLKGHSTIINIIIGAILASAVAVTFTSTPYPYLLSGLLFVLGTAFGIIFTIRVGGADMPITISLLNSLAGVSGAIAGFAIGDIQLVAIGGIVGSAGLLLTQVMCRAMNKKLFDILLGKTAVAAGGAKKSAPAASAAPKAASTPSGADYGAILKKAKKVIIVPGYGMALAQAQHKVKNLADALEGNGAEVAFAIHPVAGRMPGHMNVLLAECNVEYEKLLEMDVVNPQFKDTDVVIVVGANDVVNPAAMEAVDTPIYGMPILTVSDAKNVIVCNFDTKPGYAGVDNPLYTQDKVIMMLGDAGASMDKLYDGLTGVGASAGGASSDGNIGAILQDAKKVIFVPGYGMALGQAQHKVKQLADTLEANGAQVDYAIHPVAGRMPGHMNVLLAECNVEYEKLLEMDAVNPQFKDTDVVIVVGANDVVNPAAMEAKDTPIYGMPILTIGDAKHVIICNFDTKPGYAGVDNPLYTKAEGVTMLLGDANDSMGTLLAALANAKSGGGASGAGGDSNLPAIVQGAKKVIIVPGYGMALGQAQHKVKQLADLLEGKGAQVDFAIHPVAGRMPGHMNVLLAECNVEYEKLLEMDVVNPQFKDTDLVIVVGANDVVNPAAMEAVDTPIYGMPILTVGDAKHVIICNFDTKPGYAGVDNPLYTKSEGVTMLLGDANDSLQQIIGAASAQATGGASSTDDGGADVRKMITDAKKVIIVPGYGMALGQAQHKVKQLADALEERGAQVDYAIHPVAGRMPGHMNVLLAECNVEYEKLLEMDVVNPQFKDTDVVIVVGANDVVNPAAMEAVDTPIYGMPILTVGDAKHVIICNFDTKPGYAGVDNSLYTKDGVVMMLGDASESLEKLLSMTR